MRIITTTSKAALNDKTRTVYVLLMRSSTVFSRIIGGFTGAAYTHASIGLRPESDEFFSFARRYTHFPFPAGFIKEELGKGVMGKTRLPRVPFTRLRCQKRRMTTCGISCRICCTGRKTTSTV